VNFYHEPRLFWIAMVLGAGFRRQCGGVQHSALLQRNMQFEAIAGIEIASWIVSIAVGVGFAMVGVGYWALVWMAFALPAVTTIGVWFATGWIPGRPRRGVGVRSMLGFGGTLTLNTIIVYAAYNVDKLLIGRIWGAAALGVYGRATIDQHSD